MKISTRTFLFPLLALSALLSVAGCGGGGMTAVGISPSLNAIYVPGQTIVVDGGQSLNLTASVVNDVTGAGGKITLSGPGTLTQNSVTSGTSNETYSLTYVAPTTATAGSTATITIASGAYPAQTASITLTLNPALSITTTSIPNTIAGTAYNTPLVGVGGTTPYKWAISSGQLPTGITLASGTGVLSGTPSTAGTFNFTVSLTDSSTLAATVTQSYTLNVSPTVLTTSLANGVSGTAYSQQLTYSGGTTGVFAIASGALPTGLSLSASGVISGTPAVATAGTTYNFSVTVTSGQATSKAVSLSIAIDALPVVTTAALPSGNVGIAYTQPLAYSGGSGAAPAWAITSGSLPASSGLTLNPTTGIISGTPTVTTTYNFSVAVTVGTQTSAPQALTLMINGLVITSGSTATGEVGLPFGFQLTGAGGTAPYTWSLASGSNPLPSGLSLNGTTGLITGALASNAGSPYTGIVVEATDHVGGTATQAMTFAINPARASTNNSMLNGQYAFLLSGFDATGHPLAMAGKFTADGNGNITSGVVDLNGTGLNPSLNNGLFTTTYAVGPDDRGEFSLRFGTTTLTFTLALNGASAGISSGGYLTEFDNSGQTLTGTLALQTPAAFTTASITGGYAFGVDGFAANSSATSLTRRAIIGETQFNGTGGATSAELLSTALASSNPSVPTATSIAIGSNGRGTLSYTLPGGVTINFIAYVVSSSKLFLLSSSAAGASGSSDLLSGQALLQTIASGSFVGSSLNATSVVRMERLTPNAANTLVPDVQVGLLNFTGAGRLTLTSDENNGGVISTDSYGGSDTVAANGRVTMTLTAGFGGCADCASVETFAYLVGANQGFLMDFATSPNVGYFEPQTATGIGNASFMGAYSAGTIAPLSGIGTYFSAALNSNGAGALTGTLDSNTAGTLTPDIALSETYSLSSTGRGTIATIGNGQVLYVISPTKSLLLDLTAGNPIVQEVIHQ